MFFENNGKNINTKWNINDFVVGNGNRSRKTGAGVLASEKEDHELANTIRKIDSKFSRSEMELDSIFKDLRSKRKEMRARFKTLEADPENEAAFHKLDVDLMMAQVRVTESKAKAVSDKFKHIRDEKKLAKDLTKGATPDTVVQVANNQNQGTPLGALGAGGGIPKAPNVLRTNAFDPAMIIKPASPFEEKAETPAIGHDVTKELVKIPCSEGNGEGGTAVTPRVVKDPLVISKTWDGEVSSVAGDDTARRQEIIKYRLENQDEILKNSKSAQGIDYGRSVNAIINKQKDITKRMYINVNNGKFFIRDIEIDENGQERFSDTETYQSVMHMGSLDFNTRLKLVKTAYEDDPISYELIEDDSTMPAYYVGQWAEHDKARFLVSEEQIEKL